MGMVLAWCRARAIHPHKPQSRCRQDNHSHRPEMRCLAGTMMIIPNDHARYQKPNDDIFITHENDENHSHPPEMSSCGKRSWKYMCVYVNLLSALVCRTIGLFLLFVFNIFVHQLFSSTQWYLRNISTEQCFRKGPDFRTWSRSGPMSKNGPKNWPDLPLKSRSCLIGHSRTLYRSQTVNIPSVM